MRIAALFLLVMPFLFTNPARSAPILPGNFTRVTLTAAPVLTSLGLSLKTLGTATIDATGPAPIASFGITGGTVNADGTLSIQHNGSGLGFVSRGVEVDISNFLVDTKAGQIFADVAINGRTLTGPQTAIFAIGTGLSLTLTAAAASALDTAFNITALVAGTAIGSATTNPLVATPEPAAIAILAGGLIALTVLRRRARG